MTLPEVFVTLWIIIGMTLLLLPAVAGSAAPSDFPKWLYSDAEFEKSFGTSAYGARYLAIGTGSGIVAGAFIAVFIAIRRLLPGSWRVFLPGVCDRVRRFTATDRFKSALGLAFLLLAMLIVLLCAGVVWDQREYGRNLESLRELAKPIGGLVGSGRRASSLHLGLYFHGPEITDERLPQILQVVRAADDQKRWRRVFLDLDGSSVTDDGLRELLKLEVELDSLSLGKTNVTPEGVEKLRRERPSWKIEWRQ